MDNVLASIFCVLDSLEVHACLRNQHVVFVVNVRWWTVYLG